ncbi:hypothetical protein NHX12_022021 [Muraenolepis orangiensis]|uniref:Uncharacterized protein n=1 Tax=Muraenolepis orangiensis TaxID=630683 RepID=A0A9Q0IR02_9TELE|nr:hypothetical protein NHX12_022021 [Muraenolepis orangiensis]
MFCPTFNVASASLEGQCANINPFCSYCYSIQPGRNQRIKLVVDNHERNAGATTEEDGATATQPNHIIPSVPNGNVYLSQNGTIVRTRRLLHHPNNPKTGSPCRLAKRFKTLDMLAETHEENLPVDADEVPPPSETGNGVGVVGMCVSTTSCVVDVNLNTQIHRGSPGSRNITQLKTFGSRGSGRTMESVGPPCGADQPQTLVDNHKGSGETLESHSDHMLSDEEELWMGPWNCLHIPMTKL